MKLHNPTPGEILNEEVRKMSDEWIPVDEKPIKKGRYVKVDDNIEGQTRYVFTSDSRFTLLLKKVFKNIWRRK